MSKKNIILFLVLISLGALYIVYFTELFQKPVISISARPRVSRGTTGAANSVSFSFDRRCELTEVKVISAAEFATNKYARAYWHLISETNSAPVKGLLYGETLKGMKPKIPKMKAEPLISGETYRLIIRTENHSGQVDFLIPGRSPGR